MLSSDLHLRHVIHIAPNSCARSHLGRDRKFTDLRDMWTDILTHSIKVCTSISYGLGFIVGNEWMTVWNMWSHFQDAICVRGLDQHVIGLFYS